MSLALEWLKESGFKRIGLEVLETNQKAISFYQRHGFLNVEQRSNRFIYMEKKLLDVS